MIVERLLKDCYTINKRFLNDC